MCSWKISGKQWTIHENYLVLFYAQNKILTFLSTGSSIIKIICSWLQGQKHTFSLKLILQFFSFPACISFIPMVHSFYIFIPPWGLNRASVHLVLGYPGDWRTKWDTGNNRQKWPFQEAKTLLPSLRSTLEMMEKSLLHLLNLIVLGLKVSLNKWIVI